jgi:type I restriction enzyme S subunit
MTERQTEVGAIPEGWIIVNLEEITTKIGDGIHATPNYSNNGEYYFINGNNIRDGRIIITEETKNVDISEFKRYRKDLGESTVLLSINGTIGNLALYRGEPVILGKSVAYLNIRDQIEKTYLHHALQTDLVANQFNDGITGTTINNLGLGTIRNTQIALPPLPEQRAIATALSDADGLIGALDALIEKKRAIKQAAMQQLLTGKKRLPGFEGEWETKRLGDILTFLPTANNP